LCLSLKAGLPSLFGVVSFSKMKGGPCSRVSGASIRKKVQKYVASGTSEKKGQGRSDNSVEKTTRGHGL